MEAGYFNFRTVVSTGRLQERRFLAQWWQFYAADPHWAPPYYPALRAALSSEHVRRCRPTYLSLEALRRPASGQPTAGPGAPLMDMGWEKTVATTAVLRPPHQREALLGLLRCANDEATLHQLLDRAAAESEATSFLGPVALSPYLGAGALASHWSETPPLDTPYAPPYLAELLGEVMEPAVETRLYHLRAPAGRAKAADGPATLHPLEPARLAGELLPLVAAVYRDNGFAAPDAVEMAFLLDWWGAPAPLSGWLAEVDGRPAGFALLQPDVAPRLQRARGGRPLWRRLWLRLAAGQAERARVVLGGVAPEFRRGGIGRQLLGASLQSAADAGWKTLLAGPAAEQSAAAALLQSAGAQPRQHYQLFRWQAVSVGGGWWSAGRRAVSGCRSGSALPAPSGRGGSCSPARCDSHSRWPRPARGRSPRS